jgi:hypothetical protein
MPFQILTGNSCILTCHGWYKAQNISTELLALGVDRQGQIIEQPVSIKIGSETDEVAYIGTKGAIGEFHPETAIIDSDGAIHAAGEIVQTGNVGELRFEHAVSTEILSVSEDLISQLWSDLTTFAVAANGDTLLVPTTGGVVGTQRQEIAIELFLDDAENSGSSKYFSISESNFRSGLDENWRGALTALCDLIFSNEDDDSLTFDREAASWCLWRILIEDQFSHGAYTLSYDNLQHSTIVELQITESKSRSGLMRGSTAFFRRGKTQSHNLEWGTSSWNPISSGFILSSG